MKTCVHVQYYVSYKKYKYYTFSEELAKIKQKINSKVKKKICKTKEKTIKPLLPQPFSIQHLFQT